MKKLNDFEQLVASKNFLPKTGWIFVDKNVDTGDPKVLSNTTFYIPENEDDEFDGEEMLSTVIEAPTFLAILKNREKIYQIQPPISILLL